MPFLRKSEGGIEMKGDKGNQVCFSCGERMIEKSNVTLL